MSLLGTSLNRLSQASGQLWGIQPPSSSWAAALNLQTAVSHLLGSTAADAPRLQAAKFVEAAILQYASAPPPPPNLPPPLVDPSRSALELTGALRHATPRIFTLFGALTSLPVGKAS